MPKDVLLPKEVDIKSLDKEILTPIVLHLQTKLQDGSISLLRRFKGGWEGWLQVELAMALQHHFNDPEKSLLKYNVKREANIMIQGGVTREVKRKGLHKMNDKSTTLSGSEIRTGPDVESDYDLRHSHTSDTGKTHISTSGSEADISSKSEIGSESESQDEDEEFDLEDATERDELARKLDAEMDEVNEKYMKVAGGICDLWITPTTQQSNSIAASSLPFAYAIELKIDQELDKDGTGGERRIVDKPLFERFKLDVEKLSHGLTSTAKGPASGQDAQYHVQMIALGVTSYLKDIKANYIECKTYHQTEVEYVEVGKYSDADKKEQTLYMIWGILGSARKSKGNKEEDEKKRKEEEKRKEKEKRKEEEDKKKKKVEEESKKKKQVPAKKRPNGKGTVATPKL